MNGIGSSDFGVKVSNLQGILRGMSGNLNSLQVLKVIECLQSFKVL